MKKSKTLPSVFLIAFFVFLTFNKIQAQSGSRSDVSFNDVLNHPFTDYAQKINYGEGEFQYGLLWLPQNNPSPPLVVLIHGGCWLNSFDVNHSSALSSALAEAGFAVWSLEYRRTGDPGGGWPGTFNDIQSALSKLANLQELGIDSNRYAIAGHSAGGHLALLAGSKFKEASAVIGLAAIADIEAYARGSNNCQTATPAFMGFKPEDKPGLYESANPAKQTLHPNTLLLHGDSDTIVPLSQSQTLSLPVRIAEGAGHFDWIYPETAAFAILLDSLREYLTP